MALSLALEKSRKAMFFTLISILIITMFVLYFRMQADIPLKSKVSVTESRITSMNDFVRSFEEVYVPRALYATSHRALGAITRYTTEKNNGKTDDTKFFVENITKAFQTAVNNSKIYDHEAGFNIGLDEMTGKNIVYWLNRLSEVTKEEMDIVLEVNVTNVYIEQDYETGPWRARAVMELEYLVETHGIAGWRREKKGDDAITVEFEITGFIDPYIAAMTNGLLNRTMNISSRTTREINTIGEFMELAGTGNYVFENYSAPSFLFRFEGNTSPSYCCGIESFVYPSIVYPQDEGDTTTFQCGDGIDNDGDGQIDLNDIDCEDEFDDDEFGEDVYGNSYLDFQFWRGRCYHENPDDDNIVLHEDLSGTLWLPDPVYPGYDYLKIDSYHRFNVYPNIDPANPDLDYLTIDEYNQKYSDVEGFESVVIPIRCDPTYPNCDGCT